MLSPEQVLSEQVALPEPTRPQQLALRVVDMDTRPRAGGLHAVRPTSARPSPRQPSPPGHRARSHSNEELFLNGLHLEQYRHATYAPEPYYEEALRRDPLDSRCNNALGLLLYRRGAFAEAEPYLSQGDREPDAPQPKPLRRRASL